MATLKELSKRPELLTGGHRLCAGCGASIAVRQILLAQETPMVVGVATGCLEVATTIYPYTAWKCSYIHNAFENVAATISGVETAHRALKKRGKIKDDIKFIAFGGDGGSYDIGIQSISGALERGHNMLIVCYDNEAYMNCLSLSSLIATKEGLKKITEVKDGEEVYAFDLKTHQLVLKRCSGVFDNGVKDVYELSTLHHSIKATANHPFLVLKRNGRGGENDLVWKKLEKLWPGDEIVVSRELASGKSAQFDFKKTEKGDYKVNRINDVTIPEYSSPELMKYLGLYVGDGWIRVKKGEVGFALPENSQGREALLEFGNEHFAMEEVKAIKLVGKEPTLDLRVEDEHNFIANGIVVHNTGIQRSSATPRGAHTTTAPAGKVIPGKVQFRKDLTGIIAAHKIPYVAQAAPHNWRDLINKVQKALSIEGPSFMNILTPCPRGWRHNPEDTIEISRLATDTCFWPLYEVENGKWRVTYKPKEIRPLVEWIKMQGRFRHLNLPGNKHIIDELQERVKRDWEELLAKEKLGQ